MIKRLIRTIRRQPKGKRDSIAMGIAGVFTAMVFMVWIYNMPERFASIAEKNSNDSSPGFSQLFSEVSSQASAIKASISGEEDIKAGFEEVEPESQTVDGFWSEATTSPILVAASTTVTSSPNQASSTVSTSSSTPAQQPATVSPREVRIVTTSSSSLATTTTAEEQ